MWRQSRREHAPALYSLYRPRTHAPACFSTSSELSDKLHRYTKATSKLCPFFSSTFSLTAQLLWRVLPWTYICRSMGPSAYQPQAVPLGHRSPQVLFASGDSVMNECEQGKCFTPIVTGARHRTSNIHVPMFTRLLGKKAVSMLCANCRSGRVNNQ